LDIDDLKYGNTIIGGRDTQHWQNGEMSLVNDSISRENIQDLVHSKIDQLMSGEITFSDDIYKTIADRISKDPRIMNRIAGLEPMPPFWETIEGQEVLDRLNKQDAKLDSINDLLLKCLKLLQNAEKSYSLPL
jgi:hypothetical protein